MKYSDCIIAFLIILSGCHAGPEKNVAIIPNPAQLDIGDEIFCLKKKATISFSNAESEAVLPFLKEYLENHGIIVTLDGPDTETDVNPPDIILTLDSNDILLPEAYRIEVSKSVCRISSSTQNGLFYGIQTLRQIIMQSPKSKLIIPAMTISDSPRFEWRGMHLDVSRHFMPKEFIKKYIDYLAFLKMNVFHWHLVDDQGWRIEIKRYPKLTEVGAWRDSTLIGHYNDTPERYDQSRYGGFYTQEEIREIVDYAAQRFITIIPEIEIPGHSQAAIAAYPELGCTDDTVGVLGKWGISPYIYNIDESTFTFLFNVLDEVVALFPSPYIHIGGDEAMKDQWQSSSKIQEEMRRMKIKDETELQSYFTRRIEEYLRNKGRNIIGWDEILEGGLPASAAVMSWRGTEGGIEAVQQGHKVVMSPTDYCYFDYYQKNDSTEPLAIGGYLPVEKVYSFDPLPAGLNAEEAQLIMGVQGNVWTEYLDSPKKVEYMIFPRIFAMAEIQWTIPAQKNYISFINRLQALEVFLIENRINYAEHAFAN